MYKPRTIRACAALIWIIALVSANAQQRPGPGNVPVSNPGTATGVSSNVVTSKLLIYAKNGLGTTSTKTSGEFPSQLVASATVNNEFTVQWSRPKPGTEEKANLYVLTPNPLGRVGGKNVTMPAGATSVNIPFSMETLAPGNYVLMVVGENGRSDKVTINYTGKDNIGQVVSIPQTSPINQPVPTKSSVQVAGAQFVPAVGAPGEPGYQRAKLILNLRTVETTKISKLEVQVWSGPWTNPELLTNSKNAPLVILKGKGAIAGSLTIVKDKDNRITVTLRRTSQGDIDDQEAGPGQYSPGDWAHAFAQTTTASFRTSVDSKAISSLEQSPQKAWQSGTP